MFALMLVKARADYQYLVPFYDMMNHSNRKTNVAHKYDPYKGDKIDKKGYEIVTSKPVLAREELFNSYNHCSICQEYYDWFGTPEMFLHFGFVEGYPQRWLFDFARVKFDLDWKDGDEGTGKTSSCCCFSIFMQMRPFVTDVVAVATILLQEKLL